MGWIKVVPRIPVAPTGFPKRNSGRTFTRHSWPPSYSVLPTPFPPSLDPPPSPLLLRVVELLGNSATEWRASSGYPFTDCRKLECIRGAKGADRLGCDTSGIGRGSRSRRGRGGGVRVCGSRPRTRLDARESVIFTCSRQYSRIMD